MREILYQQNNSYCQVALMEDGDLCEYFAYEQADAASLTGSIWKGRVERIVPGMHAAFIQLGLSKNGFLPLDEVSSYKEKNASLCAHPRLQTGQEILVQVKKEPSGEKGAYLTRDITFPGKYVILLPLDSFVGVSRRVDDINDRAALSALGKEMVPPDMGLVMRAASLHADPEEVAQELASLQALWQEVLDRYPSKNAPFLIHQNLTPFHEMLRDYPAQEIGRILTNVAELSDAVIPVNIFVSSDIMSAQGVSAQVEKALHRQVWLHSGAFLVIDPCEALTVIDVNTGKFTGNKLLEDTLFTVNMEACREIARHIRLRNLGGIIVVDFIDMQEETHRRAVLDALKDALKRDRMKTVVHGYTSLGMVEITRKKARPPLYMTLTAPCPICRGAGRVRKSKQEGEIILHG